MMFKMIMKRHGKNIFLAFLLLAIAVNTLCVVTFGVNPYTLISSALVLLLSTFI